jgi:hypothetical protein
MFAVFYARDNGKIVDLRFFKWKEEIVEWFKRQKLINPDTKIIKIEKL